MKKRAIDVLFVLIALAGLCLLLYPTANEYINSLNYRKTVSGYMQSVESIDEEEYNSLIDDARAFNEDLATNPIPLYMSDRQRERYYELLNISEVGMMGYLEIPSVGILLPIFHGSSDAVLQKNVGHIEGSSLPVGGEGTHIVLSGHRGLPSAKIFTDIDKLKNGDIFTIKVLNESYTYEVDQINTVLPDVVIAREYMRIEEGKDYCTLMTCTPYGVNTHRLLVRGHRIETPEKEAEILGVRNQTEVTQINSIVVTTIVITLIVLTASIFIAIPYIRRKR